MSLQIENTFCAFFISQTSYTDGLLNEDQFTLIIIYEKMINNMTGVFTQL